ncbi:MAG: hypothetical protein WAW86_04600 [Gammaproteobacteria bacterium]
MTAGENKKNIKTMPQTNVNASQGFFGNNLQLDNAKTELLEMIKALQPAFSRPSKTLQAVFDIANGIPRNLSLHDRLRDIQYCASRHLPSASGSEQNVLGILSTYKPNQFRSIQPIIAGLQQAKNVQESRFGNLSNFVKTFLGR